MMLVRYVLCFSQICNRKNQEFFLAHYDKVLSCQRLSQLIASELLHILSLIIKTFRDHPGKHKIMSISGIKMLTWLLRRPPRHSRPLVFGPRAFNGILILVQNSE